MGVRSNLTLIGMHGLVAQKHRCISNVVRTLLCYGNEFREMRYRCISSIAMPEIGHRPATNENQHAL